jgi:LDH2 family malate/lactate/ureidoglycolate dehydrogenase
MPTLLPDALERLTSAVFQRSGAPIDHAQCVAAHLVAANLAGHDSHGVLRIPQYLDQIGAGHVNPAGRTRVVQRTAASAVVDGDRGFGQVVSRDAMLLAIEIARAGGVGAVSVRNCGHTGRIGTYTEMAAHEGLVGIAMTNAGGGGQLVAPFGGMARRLSTNPISIAAPSGGPHPIVLDIASSVAPEGKVRALYHAGKSLPPGWAIDAQGNPITDPADFYRDPVGALLPLGGPIGYKGFGLALMIDILAGALSGAGCCGPNPPEPHDGMLAIALDVRHFTPLADFQERVAGLVEYVKSCPRAPGFDAIFVPGEVEIARRAQRLREGILIEAGSWLPIVRICERLGIDPSAST